MTSIQGNEENHFHRLPDELILSIFNKVANLKCLCRCSLVTKHFATIVSRVQTIVVSIVGRASYEKEYVDRINKFVMDFRGGEQLDALLDLLSLQNIKLPPFMNKLAKLEGIYLDYQYLDKEGNSISPMREIKLCRNGAKIESFVVLQSLHMHKDAENKLENNFLHTIDTIEKAKDSWEQFRVRYLEWIVFVTVLMKFHSSLQRVIITNSEIHGELVIGGEQGANLEYGVLVRLLKQFLGHDVNIDC